MKPAVKFNKEEIKNRVKSAKFGEIFIAEHTLEKIFYKELSSCKSYCLQLALKNIYIKWPNKEIPAKYVAEIVDIFFKGEKHYVLGKESAQMIFEEPNRPMKTVHVYLTRLMKEQDTEEAIRLKSSRRSPENHIFQHGRGEVVCEYIRSIGQRNCTVAKLRSIERHISEEDLTDLLSKKRVFSWVREVAIKLLKMKEERLEREDMTAIKEERVRIERKL